MIKKVAFVEPNSTIPNIYSLIATPRLGVPILASILKSRGYEVDIYSDKIRKPSLDELLQYDIIGISSLTNSSIEGYRYADLLKKQNKTVIIGGPHATFVPDESLEHCDYVVRGEAEETILELLDALSKGESIENIKGISYKKNGTCVHNEDREFLDKYLNVSPDLSLVKGIEDFKKGLINRFTYTPMVYTSRGCPFDCRYCTVIKLAGRRLRYRDQDCCVRDIETALQGIEVRKSVMIIDDNFTVDMKRAKELLHKIIRLGKPDYVLYTIQLRVESFKDEEFLSLLNKAGFGLIHVGFESISKKSLQEWSKSLNIENIKFVVDQARAFGLKVNGLFIVGADSDTEETVQDTVDLAIELEMAVMQLFILTPLPGSDVYKQLSSENRIFTLNWKYYDCHHSVFFPKAMKPSTLQNAVIRANGKFYSRSRLLTRGTAGNRITCGVAIHTMEKLLRSYGKNLKKFEDRFYTNDEELIVERLQENNPKDNEKFLQ